MNSEARRIMRGDIDHIAEWYRKRGWTDEQIKLLPLSHTGIIVPGVAAGFLFEPHLTRVALIDGIISNPEIDANICASVLVEVIRALQRLAQENRRDYILALVADDHLAALAERCGMERQQGWSVYKLPSEP